MKVAELLREGDVPIKFEDFILEHCEPYMRELDADMDVMNSPRFSLYRGLKPTTLHGGMDIIMDDRLIKGFVKSVRTDRQPKDTPQQISDIVDGMLEEKFGWRPRSQGAFCCTFKNRGGVELYGEKYRVYPMGDLEFVYSPKVRDMTFQLSNWLRDRDAWPGHGKAIRDDMLEKVTTAIKEFIDEHGYTNKNLHAAMMAEGKPEIMVRCNKYLAIVAWND